MIRSAKLIWLILFSALLLVGCDTDWPQSSTACAVTGTVKLDGKTISDVKVVFVPQRVEQDDQQTKIASGKTDLHGEFVLKVDSRDGKQIRHGRYLVLISKINDEQELFHESYNSESAFYLEINSHEAVQRPVLDLKSTGTL